VPNILDEPRSAPWRDAVAVAVVVGLLAIAAPGANAVRAARAIEFAGRGQGTVRMLGPIFTALLGAAGAVLITAVLMTLLGRRPRKDDEPVPEWQPPAVLSRWARATVVTVAVVAAAVPFVALAIARRATTPLSPPPVAPSAVATPAPSAPPTTTHITGFAAVGAVGLAALVILALVWLVAAGRRPAVEGRGESAPRAPSAAVLLADASRAGAATLSDDDPRRAVLRCYAAMAAALRRTGVPGHASDVPGEFLRRTAAAGVVATAPVRELTALFGEARFSSHPFAEAQRQAAVAALAQIRRELAGRP